MSNRERMLAITPGKLALHSMLVAVFWTAGMVLVQMPRGTEGIVRWMVGGAIFGGMYYLGMLGLRWLMQKFPHLNW